MKVLMTTDTVGGVWTYCLELARALDAFEVQVCLVAKGAVDGSQLAQVNRISNVSFHHHDFKLEWMEDPWDDVAEAGEWLLEVARAFQPDVIHLNDYSHAALDWDAPVMVVGHSCVCSWSAAVRGAEAGEQWNRYRREVTRGLRSADLVVAPTRSMLNGLYKFYGPLSQTRVIVNGCGPERYVRHNVKQEFVFAAGRFWDPAKNLGALAAAAPDVPWPIQVAGMRHPSGRQGAAENVELLGQLTAADMREAYARAAIYALPAVYEPFGLSPLEAALSRCALVLGDIDSLHEVWGDAACYVPPRDARALAGAINALIDHPASRLALAQQGFQRAMQYSSQRMAANYMESYLRLVSRHRPSHHSPGAV